MFFKLIMLGTIESAAYSILLQTISVDISRLVYAPPFCFQRIENAHTAYNRGKK